MWQLVLFFMYFGGNEEPACSSRPNATGLEIVTSKRGKPVLLRAGYSYHKRRTYKNSSTKWLCTKRNICKAVLITASNNSIIKEENHDCEPDFVSNQLIMEFEKCVQKVTSDYTVPVPSVVRESVSEIKDRGLDLVQNIPKKKTVERKLYRKRNKSLSVNKVSFNSFKDVIVPPKFNKFVLADYCHNSTRILIFAGEFCKEILKRPNLTVFCDGTFKFCLKPFQQLYSLHVDLGSSDTYSNVIPVLYALLPKKTKNIYDTLFSLIKSQVPEFDPATFVVDFEQAAILAIQCVFPRAAISGCYFHFTRSLWRKADQLGIVKTKSKLLKKHIKRCSVMALLPRETTDDAWLYIMSHCPDNELLVKYNDYFVATWLQETSFFVDFWNVYDSQHRTTNMVECWHSLINKQICRKPSNIGQFLTLLQREDKYQQALYLKGSDITKKLKKTIEFDENLRATLTAFKEGQINLELCIERLIL